MPAWFCRLWPSSLPHAGQRLHASAHPVHRRACSRAPAARERARLDPCARPSLRQLAETLGSSSSRINRLQRAITFDRRSLPLCFSLKFFKISLANCLSLRLGFLISFPIFANSGVHQPGFRETGGFSLLPNACLIPGVLATGERFGGCAQPTPREWSGAPRQGHGF